MHMLPSLLCVKLPRHVLLIAFAFAVPSAWIALPPDILMALSLISLVPLLRYHLHTQTFTQ